MPLKHGVLTTNASGYFNMRHGYTMSCCCEPSSVCTWNGNAMPEFYHGSLTCGTGTNGCVIPTNFLISCLLRCTDGSDPTTPPTQIVAIDPSVASRTCVAVSGDCWLHPTGSLFPTGIASTGITSGIINFGIASGCHIITGIALGWPIISPNLYPNPAELQCYPDCTGELCQQIEGFYGVKPCPCNPHTLDPQASS
mgnify:FL=1